MKQKLIFLILIPLLLASCKTNTYLPSPAELKYHTKGMWFDCELPDKTKVNGELITVENNQLIILPLFGEAIAIKRNDIKEGNIQISLTTNYQDKLSRGGLIPLLVISHGYWFIFTLPINLAIVVPTLATHKSGSYVVKYPNAVTWEQMSKFARFPQGIPKNSDLPMLR